MMVSDHGFGPCLGRIHVNRILVKAGVARLPGLAGLIERRTLQAGDRLRLWGQKRDDPAARSASFDQSVTAQYPFDWKRTLAFAPHQDTAAMVYVELRRPSRWREDQRPQMSPRKSTRPAPPPLLLSPKRNTRKTARAYFLRSSKRPRPTRSIPPARDIPT